MMILVINAGSSSLKYQLFDMANGSVLAKGLCDRIGIDGKLDHRAEGKEKYVTDLEMKNHTQAIKYVMDALLSPEHGVISSLAEIKAVGHRVVQGADLFTESALITDEVLAAIEACVPLAPLHNPAHISGIKACRDVLGPDIPNVAVFDTAFHQTMPPHAYLYPVPYEYCVKYKIRRYGFHGTSHMYVSRRAAAMLGRPIEELKIVTCHLGNGSSITAVNGGKSIDTTMGFTPLDGLLMGTRTGSLDPAIATFIMEKEGLSPKEVDTIFNKKSGALGVSGVSSDFRDLIAACAEGNERAGLAIDIFCYQVKKYIGAYAAAMGGLDAVVFTAGIGENNSEFRQRMVDGLDFLGLAIDPELNAKRGKEIDVSAAGARAHVLVIPTNEELVIASDTERIVSGK